MAPPASAGGSAPSPNEIFGESEHARRFVEHTLATRDDDSSRVLLEREWRYIGPFLERLPADARVLDLACGVGPHVLAWAERGYRVTGIDFLQRLLVAGRERLARSARPSHGATAVPPPDWNCGDATRMPYRDASFDVVYCNSLVEHVPDWRAVLSETARVLKPGGLAVVYTTNRTCPLQLEVNHFPFYSWLPDPIQRRVLAWIMEHRRDMVNWTDFPAVNWFTFPGMRSAFESVGLQPYDRIDLIAGSGAGGAKGAIVRAMHAAPVLKWPYYFYAISMGMYGVKR